MVEKQIISQPYDESGFALVESFALTDPQGSTSHTLKAFPDSLVVSFTRRTCTSAVTFLLVCELLSFLYLWGST